MGGILPVEFFVCRCKRYFMTYILFGPPLFDYLLHTVINGLISPNFDVALAVPHTKQ